MSLLYSRVSSKKLHIVDAFFLINHFAYLSLLNSMAELHSFNRYHMDNVLLGRRDGVDVPLLNNLWPCHAECAWLRGKISVF